MLTSIKHSVRLFRIGLTLARHDALFGLEALDVSPVITTICKWLARQNVDARPGKRLTLAFEELGPTFIKLGQALSTRPDLVGEDIARDLSELRDNIPPFDSKTARHIVEAEFERPLTELFSQFDDKPIAAASIAQVHRAVTIEGKDVAVKILRPDIADAFARDMKLLYWLADIVQRRLPSWRRLKPVESVKIFADSLRFELDLRYEAAACEELKENTAHDEGFYVPQIDWQRTSQRVLTSEWIHGISAGDVDALKAANIDLPKLVEYAASAFFNQVFRDGFFHADMHPGNLFVLPDGRLAVVDFGIMGRIDRESQLYLAEILWGFLQGDYLKVAQRHIDAGYVPKHQSVEMFAQACRAIAQPILGKPLHEISVAKLLGQLFQVADTFEMETQPQLLLLQKTMMLAEGVGRSLNPQVNMWKMAEPLIAQWARANLSPQARVKAAAADTFEALQRLPYVLQKAEAIVTRVHDGGISLHPDTVALMRSNRRTTRLWLAVAWCALGLAATWMALEWL